MTDILLSREIARSVQLRYVRSDQKGFSRKAKGKKFIYLDTEGREIKDPDVIGHIQGLVLPPAWTNVWICPYPNGHLQATGIDARGRKQYRYHNRWSQVRNQDKFGRLYAFGKKLPLLRQRISRDIRRRTLIREKVSAIALGIMNETFIRAGNTAYEKEYGSFGLTTLKNRHVAINGSSAFFKFKGKKGVQQQIMLKHAALTRLLGQVKELPGQELFQYYDEEGMIHKLDSGDINAYLKANMQEDFSCKDFRTWAGSVLALRLLAQVPPAASEAERKRNIVAVVDAVAAKLGNTRAICRKYYIHPALLLAYETGNLESTLEKLKKQPAGTNLNQQTEKVLLSFLKPLQ
jgi:DNA topoisomerase-1